MPPERVRNLGAAARRGANAGASAVAGRDGRLYRKHRGVYGVTDPRLLPSADEAAALLAIGPQAVISHRSAAAKWSLTRRDPAVVDVVLVGTDSRTRRGIRIHRVARLDPRDVTTKGSLRITAPARSAIDFATDAPLPEVEHALSEARALGLLRDSGLDAALSRVPLNHRGAARVKALVGRQVGRAVTRSERERKLLKLLYEAGLPKPLVNQRLHGYVPDFYWPEFRLILEFDGYRTHGGRRNFESDRKRDQTFAAAGIQTMRATWLQLEHEPVALVVRVGQAMTARAA